ncbi:hypothetical protein SNEBB_000193 [Seison nebaliae]|nr:hypothetical protein SNEBB_000193 [Seison nebaliae]
MARRMREILNDNQPYIDRYLRRLSKNYDVADLYGEYQNPRDEKLECDNSEAESEIESENETEMSMDVSWSSTQEKEYAEQREYEKLLQQKRQEKYDEEIKEKKEESEKD